MRRKAVEECYSNSTWVFMQRTNYYRYVEGYVLPPYLQRPIAHASVITPEDQVIDVTLQKPELYSYTGVVSINGCSTRR